MSTNPTTLNDVQPDGFFTRSLAEVDPAVFAGVEHELDREQTQIELIASERAATPPTRSSSWRSIAPSSCSAAALPTSSRTRARRRTAR